MLARLGDKAQEQPTPKSRAIWIRTWYFNTRSRYIFRLSHLSGAAEFVVRTATMQYSPVDISPSELLILLWFEARLPTSELPTIRSAAQSASPLPLRIAVLSM